MSSSRDQLYQSSRRHPRTYILTHFFKKQYFKSFWALSEGPRGSTPTFSNPSPNDTHLRIFSRLSTAILTFLEAVELKRPTSNLCQHRIRIPPRLTYPNIFSHLSTTILTILEAVEPKPPTSPLHQHQIRIRLLALPNLGFFPTSLHPFSTILKRWSLTSYVTLTPS